MRLLGLLIGIPSENMPHDVGAFERYWESMLATELEAGPAARELMAFLMSSSLSRPSKWTRVAPLTHLDDAWIRMSIPHDSAVALGLRPTEQRRRLPMSLKPVEPLTGVAADVARDLMQTGSRPTPRA